MPTVGSRCSSATDASDRKAALLADVLFAKDSLAEWCATFGVPALPFTTLEDVRQALIGGA